jgi:hypothetical protein
VTLQPVRDPLPQPLRIPLTAPPSNPAVDNAELVRRLAALERVLGR